MGAGISKKAWQSRQYKRLKVIERLLEAKGIPCKYKNLEVRGPHFVAYFAGIGPASNGERFAYLVLRFNPTNEPSACKKAEGDVDYTDFHTRDIPESSKGGWEAGVQRVLESVQVAAV